MTKKATSTPAPAPAPRSWLTWTVLASIIVVALISILDAIPHRELDWDDTILPLARNYAGLTTDIMDAAGADAAGATTFEKPLHGKIIVVTGCTNGIGLSLTKAFSKLGATVIGIGRSPDKLSQLKEQIPTIETVRADFNDLESVSLAATEISEKFEYVDILVNNAGIHDSLSNLWGTAESAQGYDRTFAVNYLSHFLLTEKLSPALLHNSTKRPTLVQISSSFHWAVDGSDLRMMVGDGDNIMPLAAQRGGSTGFYVFRSQRSYANSKLAQIYHARALKRKHPLWSSSSSSSSSSARVVSICPAWVGTNIGGKQGSWGHTIMQFGFPVDGWGIASALIGTLEDSTHDFYYNSKVFGVLNIVYRNLPHWFYSFGLRDMMTFVMAMSAQKAQKLAPYAGPTISSPESYNERVADALYDWSYQAVKEYL